MSVNEIMAQAKSLSLQERKELVKLLVDTLDTPASEQRNILEFEGIAAHYTDDEDPKKYVKRIRSEWDDRP